jgi:UPF0755 protein
MVVAALGIWLCWGLLLPMKPSRGEVVLLRPGWSTRHIALELKSAGVIHSANAFLLYHYVVKPRSLKAGEYQFDGFASAVQVHSRLVRGDVLTHTVVIPEGFNMFDIANAIEAAGLGPKEDFLKAAREETSLVHDIDPQATSLEGYLFPDTYEFTRTQSMSDVAAVMVRRFRQEARDIGLIAPNGGTAGAAVPAAADVHRIVTLASIVEKETAAAEERPLVASVYQNRLSKRIALNADPSIIYAALLSGKYQGTIYQSDLKSNSPYNTYRYAGLPPGPIANPGRDSLKAALHPASSDYYYFVSDNNGHHRFARTLSEHSHNVVLYRRALAAANRQSANQNR